MEEPTTDKKPSNKLTIALFLIIAGISGFSYYMYMQSAETESKLNAEKAVMIEKLTKSKDSISLVINDNTSIKSELLVQQQKISNLIDELKVSKSSLEELNQYKVEVARLRKQVVVLQNDKMELVQKYEALKNKQDSTLVVLESTTKSKNQLEELTVDMNRMVKKSARVTFASLKTETISKSKSGGASFTDSSSKVNFIRLNFVAIGNKQTIPVEKEYYVQIIDPKNNVIGNKLSKKFGPMILDYSYSAKFSYVDTNLDVSSGIEMSKAEKGNYFVNVFDKEQLVLKSSFTLK
jgi:hypothetical protein